MDSRCLHVAVNLDLADSVTDDPRDLVDVAQEVGADPGALARIVRHLVSLGVFEFRAGRIWHNEASRLLRTDDPSGLSPLIRMEALPVIWDSFGSLDAAVRTGRPRNDVRRSRRVLPLPGRPPVEALASRASPCNPEASSPTPYPTPTATCCPT